MRIGIIIMLSILSFESMAQLTVPKDWHFLSLEKDSIYGAEVYKAYDFIQEKKQKKQVVVAIIDSGSDYEHEDLKDALWVNYDEIPNNGIDDDRNGYIDDIHGWNFLGSKNKNLIDAPLESDREYLRLESKYIGIDPKDVKKSDSKEYEVFINQIIPYSRMASSVKSNNNLKKLIEYSDVFTKEMEAKFPGEKFKEEHLKSIVPSKDDKEKFNAYRNCIHWFFSQKRAEMYFWDDIVKYQLEMYQKRVDRIKETRKSYSNPRAIINDDYNNIKDRFYGNDSICTKHSLHGTHVAGIIGATRGNELGIDGVADVKLMIIRAVPNGDEYDKDIALAIRYAVENGANIINMSFGKSISPNKKWVTKAMKFAEKRGVLLVSAAGNSSRLIDEHPHYPVKYITERKVLSNFITVGAISSDGKPAKFSNYGERDVDLFAPGVDVYSTVLGNKYQSMSGTSMAAPVVAGVAAMIWSYYPELSVQELKDVILKGVTSRKGEIVAKHKKWKYKKPTKPVEFSKFCSTAGILNAHKSVMLADEIVNK